MDRSGDLRGRMRRQDFSNLEVTAVLGASGVQSPDRARFVTVAGRGSDTVPAGTLAAMRRATGLDDLR
jgi:hypothetical protein